MAKATALPWSRAGWFNASIQGAAPQKEGRSGVQGKPCLADLFCEGLFQLFAEATGVSLIQGFPCAANGIFHFSGPGGGKDLRRSPLKLSLNQAHLF